MCLERVTDNGPFPPEKEVVAWGRFIQRPFNLLYSFAYDDKPLSIGKWIKAIGRPIDIYGDGITRYKCGFHKFVKKNAAEEYCPNRHDGVVRKVKLRKIVAIGMQDSNCRMRKCYVAREMFIIPTKEELSRIKVGSKKK